MIFVKFSTLAGGVFIEQVDHPNYFSSTRCFRFDAHGNSEFAYYGDLNSNNPAPRWYGHTFKQDAFILA